ncbi:MAG: dihydropteroate synthase [Bacteroidales bacterium]|nr:dihydropteroate synthase [Bacteroidales bacterium]
METKLRGKTKEVVINTEGPFVIIGESINPTRRKKLVDTLSDHNFEYVLELAGKQIDAGAGILDVNVGFPGVDDLYLLPETVKAINEKYDIPLCIDSPNPEAIRAALKVADGKCIINSVTGEEKSLRSVLPVALEYGAAVIGLVMDDEGISHEPEKRLRIAEKILEQAVKTGIMENDVIIDPLVMAVSADPGAALVTLETIRLVHEKLALNITQGTSNISFGLPGRDTINSVFMAFSILNGLTCAITNPARIAAAVRAADLLRDRDDYAMRFVEYFQGGP